MATTMRPTLVETEGNESDGRFQPVTKADAVRCLQAAIESFLAARGKSRDWLAEDICGMSTSNFSKVVNGVQGDFLALVYDKLPGEIRQDYDERIAEMERFDPLGLALEQLLATTIRVIRAHSRAVPAKAELPERRQEKAS